MKSRLVLLKNNDTLQIRRRESTRKVNTTMKFSTYMENLTMLAMVTRLYWDSLRRAILDDEFHFQDPIKGILFEASVRSAETHIENLVGLTHICEEYDEEEINKEAFAEKVLNEAISAALEFKTVEKTLGNIPMEDEEEADLVTDLQIMIRRSLFHVMEL